MQPKRERTPSTFVISITPFADDGTLDEERIRSHFSRLARAGMGAYVAGSGSGEAYTLSDDEIFRLLTIAVDELKGKVPVRAMGREPRTANEMIDFVELAASAGVDAAQIYSLDMGHAQFPSASELAAYYDAVLSQVDMPVVLSTHFSVGYLLPVELLTDLVDRYSNIIGINSTSPDLFYLIDLLDAVPASIDVHVGGPNFALDALALGASGYLSSEANVAPALCQAVIDCYAAGDLAGATDAYARVMRLFRVNMRQNAVSAGRVELDLLGASVGPARLPRLGIESDEHRDELARVLRGLRIAEIEAGGWAAR